MWYCIGDVLGWTQLLGIGDVLGWTQLVVMAWCVMLSTTCAKSSTTAVLLCLDVGSTFTLICVCLDQILTYTAVCVC